MLAPEVSRPFGGPIIDRLADSVGRIVLDVPRANDPPLVQFSRDLAVCVGEAGQPFDLGQ